MIHLNLEDDATTTDRKGDATHSYFLISMLSWPTSEPQAVRPRANRGMVLEFTRHYPSVSRLTLLLHNASAQIGSYDATATINTETLKL